MRNLTLLARFAALLTALALPALVFANGCSPGGSSSSICPMGESGTGLRSSTLTPSTQAPAIAITNMLSGVGSGLGAPGSGQYFQTLDIGRFQP